MTGFVEILKDIGSADSASGAITIALVSAVIAWVGWVLSKLCAGIYNYYTNRKNRREAITHLFVDALSCRYMVKNSFRQEECDRFLKLLENASQGFRAYVETYEERDISKEVAPHIASLPKEEIAIISIYLEERGTFRKYYGKTGSKEFASLSNDRKGNVIRNLFYLARTLEIISDKLITTMKSKCRRKYLKKIEETHNELMSHLDRTESCKGKGIRDDSGLSTQSAAQER